MKDYGQISGRPDLVNTFYDAIISYETKEKEWITRLRNEGYKASHPNDGWIDRENNKMLFVYPQFNDGVDIGDKIVIGSHDSKERSVILTGKSEGYFNDYYNFKDI